MKSTWKGVVAGLIAVFQVVCPTLTFATAPIRHSSDNGQGQSASTWSLSGPTDLISFPNLDLKMSLQVRCPKQDVAAVSSTQGIPTPDPANAGGCTSGAYLFLFQIPSGPENLEITFKNLIGFTFKDDPNDRFGSTVGVMLCDDANVAALCTQLAATGPASQFPNITFTHNKANTEVTFLIPRIHAYPTAPCPTPDPNNPFPCFPGHGLTLFLQTAQSSPLPIGFPTVRVKTDKDLD